MFIKKLTKMSPSRIILLSAVVTIVIGVIFLSLPVSQIVPISFLNVLFIIISAITATGLHPIPLANFSFFGQCVITALMQVGSLGIIILTLLILHTFFRPDQSTKKAAAELLGVKRKRDTKRMLIFVVVFSLAIEIICALIMLIRLKADYPLGYGFFFSLFHAISAFSNTGFTLFTNKAELNSMEPYNDSYIILGTLCFLMLFGAIGFTTIKEFVRYLGSLTTKVRYRFSLSSRIIWRTTFLLILCSFMLCLALEANHAFAGMSAGQAAMNALFYVISSMGNGMQAVSSAVTKVATMLLIMVIAFIGGSPGSTGSGVKTTTIAIFFAALRSSIRGKDHVILRGQRISPSQVTKAISMITLSIPFIIVMTFLLLVSEGKITLLDGVFETVSAFANLGMSTGITTDLSVIGRLLICVTMLVGRLGPFTLIFALRPNIPPKERSASKKEKVQIP